MFFCSVAWHVLLVVELLTELLKQLSGNALKSFESSYFPREMHCGSMTSVQIDG